MEKIVDELFKLVDNSSIEKILKSITILDNMTKEEVHFINLFIENDKKNNFSRIKYLYALEFSISYGYLVDKIENRVIFKIITSELSVYIRTTLTKTLQKYEKITIINIEKTILNILNAKMEDGINKNIESMNGKELINVQHAYLDSYNVIVRVYENYTKVIQQFFIVINEIILLFLRPFFFDTNYGFLRNSLNITFISIYSLCLYNFLFKPSLDEKKNNTKRCVNQQNITKDILTFFNNLNIIVEKNKVEDELSNLLNSMVKVISDPTFINLHQLRKCNNNHLNVMKTYKRLETIASLIVNDSYLFTLSSTVKFAIMSLVDKIYAFKQILNMSSEIIDIINLKSYYISDPILWDQTKNYEYLFVLKDVAVEYQENNKYTPVLIDVNLNFELNGIHFIYGNSGSGKTTLINILMKKIKIKNGSIKFLNQYENYTYFSIRKYLSYLTSESILFSKSIYYNIIFGLNENVLKKRKDEIYQEIIKYMNIFNMKSFIPDINSKNSKKMSKGQTQRIAIIRLFINIIFDNVKILFLDEFTSNIDNDMEKIIFNELLQLHSRFPFTIFFISHNMYNMKYSNFNYKFNVDEYSITKSITNKEDVLCIE